jgi:hypothetical protein
VGGTGIKRQIEARHQHTYRFAGFEDDSGLLLHGVAIIIYQKFEPSSAVTESTASARLALGLVGPIVQRRWGLWHIERPEMRSG